MCAIATSPPVLSAKSELDGGFTMTFIGHGEYSKQNLYPLLCLEEVGARNNARTESV